MVTAIFKNSYAAYFYLDFSHFKLQKPIDLLTLQEGPSLRKSNSKRVNKATSFHPKDSKVNNAMMILYLVRFGFVYALGLRA